MTSISDIFTSFIKVGSLGFIAMVFKEPFIKAIKLLPDIIEIINNEKGKPILKLHFTIPYLKSLELTLSHCKEYAIANVVVIFR